MRQQAGSCANRNAAANDAVRADLSLTGNIGIGVDDRGADGLPSENIDCETQVDCAI
jgi:hypothetical protein